MEQEKLDAGTSLSHASLWIFALVKRIDIAGYLARGSMSGNVEKLLIGFIFFLPTGIPSARHATMNLERKRGKTNFRRHGASYA